MKLAILILCALPAFAGQSLILGNSGGIQGATNTSVPAQNGSWDIEFNADVIPATLGAFSGNYCIGNPFAPYLAVPVKIQCNNSGGLTALAFTFINESGSSGLPNIQIGGISGGAAWVKIVHDSTAKIDYVNIWDHNGNVVSSNQQIYTSESTNTLTGYQILGGQGADAINWAWFRVCTGSAVVALRGAVPTTFGGCAAGTYLLEWKFDNTLLDASGNGYTATLSGAGGSTAVYAASLYQTVVPILKTVGAPSWNYTVSLRAGNVAQLDATGCYSQADTTNTCVPFWQVLSGPASGIWQDAQSASQPHLILPVFGDYLVQLSASDSAGNLATATADIGAVATDSNGIVVQAQSTADDIFGNMITWGQNPWGYQDLLSKTMVDEQYTYQGCCTPPTWVIPGTGTISYTFCGVGLCGTTATTISGNINASVLTVPVTNASLIDLSVLPTTIAIDGEVMLVTAASATSGAANLTIGYDGRGLQGGGSFVTAAASHSSGAQVQQFKITGTSTLFTSDPVTPICPAASGTGLPAPPGRIIYQTGTVTMTPGSASITGVGTTWTNGNGVGTGQTILVYATHAGGTRFNFFTTLTLNSTTSITGAVVYPSDADSGTFTYAIVQYRYPSLEYTRVSDGSIGRTIQNGIQVCLGDTQLGGVAAHDYGSPTTTTLMTGHYAYKDGLGAISAFGPNFYCTGCAAEAHYLRSGSAKALTLANFVNDYWCRDPEVDGGYAGGFILNEGWGALGCIADYATQPNSVLRTTSDKGTATGLWFARGFIGRANQVTTEGCNDDDTRDTGLFRMLTAVGAKYDTGSFQTTWITQLENIYNMHDVGGNACKQTDNSFSNAFILGPSIATLGLTNGSTNVTGSGFTSGLCSIVASGTITVTNGSGAATSASGTGFSGANPATNLRAIIQGPAGYVTAFSYVWNSNSSITLNGLWPTTTGTYSYSIDSAIPTTIGASINDSANLQILHACTYVSPTQLTLDRNWGGTTGTYNEYNTGISSTGSYTAVGGYGQQPFMLNGPGVYSLNFAAKVSDGSYPALWRTLANNVATVGTATPFYDPVSKGLQYGVFFGGCDQKTPTANNTDFIYGGSNDYCQTGSSLAGIAAARTLTVEGLNALSVAYAANPSPTLKTQFDGMYGSSWGKAGYTTGGTYAGDNNPCDQCTAASVASYKWPGFLFGAGMSHRWPADRLGGVAPAVPRTIGVGICFYDAAKCKGTPQTATSVKVSITLPNGTTSTNTCSSGLTCSVIGDSRQGQTYPVTIQYIAAGVVLQSGVAQITAP